MIDQALLTGMYLQSIIPVGPVPDILAKDQEVPAAAAALRSTNQ